MKYLISFTLLLFSTLSYSQDAETRSASSSEYAWYQVDTKAWAFDTNIDTLSFDTEPDSIIFGGDTLIVDYPDSLTINFPHNLGTSFVGVITVNMDTIQAYDDLTGTFVIQTAQCSTCPWTSEFTATALPAVSAFTRVAFEVRNIKMRLLIIATAGLGSVNSYITIKPASITKT